MGAGHGFDTRAVWSPAGGWYADPRGWRKNTALAFAAVACISYAVASVSAKLEVRRGGGGAGGAGRGVHAARVAGTAGRAQAGEPAFVHSRLLGLASERCAGAARGGRGSTRRGAADARHCCGGAARRRLLPRLPHCAQAARRVR